MKKNYISNSAVENQLFCEYCTILFLYPRMKQLNEIGLEIFTKMIC